MSAVATDLNVNADGSGQLPQLCIVNRLQKVALVNQALDLANKSYARLKSSNGLVQATLTQAESMAEQFAKPVLNHLEQPIQIADKYACQGFDTIESKVQSLAQNSNIEMVRKRVEETIQVLQTSSKQLRTMLEQSMDQTKQRVESLKKQSSEHLNSMLSVSKTFIRSVDNSLNAAENALDRLMPALNPESEPQSPIDNLPSLDQTTSETESLRLLFQRMVRFSDKLRRRIGQHTVEKWYTTFLQSAENFQANILKILQAQASKYPSITSAIMKPVTTTTDQNSDQKPKQS